MILINLLPHREAARKRRRDAFNVASVVSLLAGALIGAAVYFWFQSQISTQQERNQYLQGEVTKLEQQIKAIASIEAEIIALKARQKAVEDLQADRNLPVHLLNELSRQLPDGVYLNNVKQEAQTVLIQGVAQSNERVSELLRNLADNTPWLAKPQLVEIVNGLLALTPRDQRRVANFHIKVDLVRPNDIKNKNAVAPEQLAAASPATLTK